VSKQDLPLNLSYDKETKRFSLWGMSGGQLEFVSKRLEMRGNTPFIVLRFTDHDVQAIKDFSILEELAEGEFYEIEIPVAEYGILD